MTDPRQQAIDAINDGIKGFIAQSYAPAVANPGVPQPVGDFGAIALDAIVAGLADGSIVPEALGLRRAGAFVEAGYVIDKVTVVCDNCGKGLAVAASVVASFDGRFCDTECADAYGLR